MTKPPKTRSNQASAPRKKRRHSSSDSDNDGHDQRFRSRQQQQQQDDRNTNSFKQPEFRIKEEPMTDDDSRRRSAPAFPRQHQTQSQSQSHSRSQRPPQRNQQKTESYQWGPRQQANQDEEDDKSKATVQKEQPNFGLSGALLKDSNMYRGVVIKYNEPIEARKPKRRWRLYVFKGEQELPMYQIHRQSAYLFGRERMVCDIPIDHPSCSKQHSVLQYRLMDYKRDDGSQGRHVIPYIIDLGSANGTYINNKRIESERYYELKENDVIKFAFSTREYVLLHEDSATSILKEGDEDDGFDATVKDEEDKK